MRVLGPYFVPDDRRAGRSSLDALDEALHDLQGDGLRAAALVVERSDGRVYTWTPDRLSAERRRRLADALYRRLTAEDT